MTYKCDPCNYQSEDKYNYDRHMRGTKHNNINVKMMCKYCDIPYIDLDIHIKCCPQKNNYEFKLELLNKTLIEKLKSVESNYIKLESQFKELYDEHKKYTNNLIQKDNKYTDTLISAATTNNNRIDNLIQNTGIFANNSLNTINNTVSALKFIQTNYNTAPPLKALSNYNCFKKTTTEKFIPELLHYYKNDQLIKYIGNTYTQEYLKDNPNEQAMWNSDQSRLSYYVRETGKDKGEVDYDEWTQDKQGLKIIEITIKPILRFLCTELDIYMNTYVDDCDYKTMESCAKLKEFLNGTPQKKPLGKVVRSLPEEIVKYIGPKFLINKSKKAVKLLKHSSVSIEEINDADEVVEVEEDEDDDREIIQPTIPKGLPSPKIKPIKKVTKKEVLCEDLDGIIPHHQEFEEEIYDTKKTILRLKPDRKKIKK
jgi:hypothetical protein